MTGWNENVAGIIDYYVGITLKTSCDRVIWVSMLKNKSPVLSPCHYCIGVTWYFKQGMWELLGNGPNEAPAVVFLHSLTFAVIVME